MAALSLGSKDSYYSINFFNQSNEPVKCSNFTQLDVDLFNRVTDRQLNIAVARLRIPTDLIPLSQHSIPFREWAFGISNSNDSQETDIKWAWVKTNGETSGSFYRSASGFDAVTAATKIVETSTASSNPVRTISTGGTGVTLVPCNFDTGGAPFGFFLYFDDTDPTGKIYLVVYDDQDFLVTTPTVVYTAGVQVLALSINPLSGGMFIVTRHDATHLGFKYFDYAGSKAWNTTDTLNSGVLDNIDPTDPLFSTVFCTTISISGVGPYGIISCLGNLYYFVCSQSTTTATVATLPTDTKAISPYISPMGNELYVLAEYSTAPPPSDTMYLFGMVGTKTSLVNLLDMLAVKNGDGANINYQPAFTNPTSGTPMSALLLNSNTEDHNPWSITKANSNSLVVGFSSSSVNYITYRHQPVPNVSPAVYTTTKVWPQSNNEEDGLPSLMPYDDTLHCNYENGHVFTVSRYRERGFRVPGSLAPDPSSWVVPRSFISYATNVTGTTTYSATYSYFQTSESQFPVKHLSFNFDANGGSPVAGELIVYGYNSDNGELMAFDNDLLNRDTFCDNIFLFSPATTVDGNFVPDYLSTEVPKPYNFTWSHHALGFDYVGKLPGPTQGELLTLPELGTYFGHGGSTSGTLPSVPTDSDLLSRLVAAFGLKRASFHARFDHNGFWNYGTMFAPFPTYPMKVIGNTLLFSMTHVDEMPGPATGVTYSGTAICAHQIAQLPTSTTTLSASPDSLLATRSDYGFPFSNGFHFTAIDVTQGNNGYTLVGFSMANEHYNSGSHAWTTAAGGRMYYQGCALLNPYTGKFVGNTMQVSSSGSLGLFGSPNASDGFGSTPGRVLLVDAVVSGPANTSAVAVLVAERLGCPDGANNLTAVQGQASLWQVNFHNTDNSLTTYSLLYTVESKGSQWLENAVDLCVFSEPNNQVAMNWVLVAKSNPPGSNFETSCVGWQLDASNVYGTGGQPFPFFIHAPWDTSSTDLTIVKVQSVARNPLQAPLVMMRIVGNSTPYARDVLYAIQETNWPPPGSQWKFELIPLTWREINELDVGVDTVMTQITPYDASFCMYGSLALLSNPTRTRTTDQIGVIRAMSVNPYDATMAYVPDSDTATSFNYTSVPITEILDEPQATWQPVNVENSDYGTRQTPFKIYDFQPSSGGGGGGGSVTNEQQLLTYVASGDTIDPPALDYASPSSNYVPHAGLTLYGYFSVTSGNTVIISGSDDGLGAMFSFSNDLFSKESSFPSLSAPLTGYTPSPISSRPGPDQTIEQYQEYVNAFNEAISSIVLPSSWSITKPYMKVDTVNRVFYVTLPYEFSSAATSAGYKFYVNDNLQEILDMPLVDAHTTTPSSDGDVLFYEVSTKRPFATAGSSYDIMQEGRSFGKLFDIARIFVESPGLPVAGTLEGTNSNVQCITDIFPDVDTLTPGAALIYQPFFDRWYTMTQRDPVQRINVQIKYQTRSGEIYPISVSPGDFWGILLVFRRIGLM